MVRGRVAVLRGLLQIADDVRAVGVPLEAPAEPIEACEIELFRRGTERGAVPVEDVARQVHKLASPDERARVGETPVHHFPIEPDDLEEFSAQVTGKRRDPHLRHDLLDACLDAAAEVTQRIRKGEIAQLLPPGQVRNDFERQVGIHRRRPVADQRGEVMRFPGFRRLEHQVRFVADPCRGQPFDHRAHDQQHRHSRALGVHSAVA